MIKDLDEIKTKSKGTELLQSLSDESKVEDVSTYVKPTEEVQTSPDESEQPYTSKIKEGVEVVDVKAIEKYKKKRKVDKFGIPIQPGEHRNFDRI